MTTKKTTKKTKKSKKTKFKPSFNFYIYLVLGTCAVVLAIIGITYRINLNEGTIETNNFIKSEEEIPGLIEDDKGEMIEIEDIPTYEEIDGGRFEDKDTGLSLNNGEYEDLGWSELYNTSSPEAFKNDTLNKCIYANNRYGAQCVSLARVFWWSYADRDVSTCGTGMAKGMMECADQNAGDDFKVYWSDSQDKIQAGDWLVFGGGKWGHTCMSLGPIHNGYVTCLGENQNGGYCELGGSATNIVNLSLKNLIGFYRPKLYIQPEPKPEPQPCAPDTSIVK